MHQRESSNQVFSFPVDLQGCPGMIGPRCFGVVTHKCGFGYSHSCISSPPQLMILPIFPPPRDEGAYEAKIGVPRTSFSSVSAYRASIAVCDRGVASEAGWPSATNAVGASAPVAVADIAGVCSSSQVFQASKRGHVPVLRQDLQILSMGEPIARDVDLGRAPAPDDDLPFACFARTPPRASA